MENKVEVIDYKGVFMVYGDFSDLSYNEFILIIEQIELESLKLPSTNILHLLNFTECKMNDSAKKRTYKMIENLVMNNGRRVRTAAFGVTGLQRTIANAVKGDIYFAKDIDDAIEWLLEK